VVRAWPEADSEQPPPPSSRVTASGKKVSRDGLGIVSAPGFGRAEALPRPARPRRFLKIQNLANPLIGAAWPHSERFRLPPRTCPLACARLTLPRTDRGATTGQGRCWTRGGGNSSASSAARPRLRLLVRLRVHFPGRLRRGRSSRGRGASGSAGSRSADPRSV